MSDQKGQFRDWLVVILLMSAMVFSLVDRFVLSLLLEPIKADLNITDSQLGLLSGIAFGLFYAFMGLPLGWLADRWSRKGTILVGLGTWSVATAFCGLAGNYIQLLTARIAVGAGEAGLAPASYSIVYDRFPRHMLSRAMSLFQVGAVLGSGLALFLAGAIYTFFKNGGGLAFPLIGDLQPWQQTFIIFSLPGLPFMAMLAFIQEPKRIPSKTPGKEFNQSLLAVLKDDIFLYSTLFLGMSGVVLATYALLSWVPSILIREFSWSPGTVGATYGAIVSIVSSIGLLTGGALADFLVRREVKFAHIAIAFGSAAVALPCFLLLSLPLNATAILMLVAAAHLALSLPIGVVPAFIQTVTIANARGRVSAVYVLTVNIIGLGIGPTAIGAISQSLSYEAAGLRHGVVLVSSLFLVISIISLTLLLRRVARQ